LRNFGAPSTPSFPRAPTPSFPRAPTPSFPRAPTPSFPRKRESPGAFPPKQKKSHGSRSRIRPLALAAILLLSACGAPLKPANFAGSGNFNPIAFFTGHEKSWGVEEDRAGQPIAIVTTDCLGTPDSIGLTMVQTLHVGGKTTTRTWHLRQTGEKTYEATANDMAGSATGTVGGRVMHWRWILETSPGEKLKNVTMDQWFYRMDDGAVLVRTIVTKAGIRLLEISEQFEKT
jgi:hypothetical protein